METLLLLRKAKGLTQKDVADALGISRQAYANYETGNREPDLATLKTLAHFFSVTVDYLLGKTEKPADEGELTENLIIYHRDGKTVRRKLSKSQYTMLRAILDAIPEDDDEDDI